MLQSQQHSPAATGDLTILLTAVQTTCKFIATNVRRAGLLNLYVLLSSRLVCLLLRNAAMWGAAAASCWCAPYTMLDNCTQSLLHLLVSCAALRLRNVVHRQLN